MRENLMAVYRRQFGSFSTSQYVYNNNNHVSGFYTTHLKISFH